MPDRNMFERGISRRRRRHVLRDDISQGEREHELRTSATLEPAKTGGNVAQFKQYTIRGKSTPALKQRIAVFLAKLAQATTPDTVRYLCQEEKSWFLDKYGASATRSTYMSAYRYAVQDCFSDIGIPAGLASERKPVKGLVVEHVAMEYMLLPEDYQAVRVQTAAKTASQRDHLSAFNLEAAIALTKTALQSEDWRELAAGLTMSVQARPSDMLQSGDFKAVTKYQVEFTSRAKQRGTEVIGNVWTLVESATFIDAFHRLRCHPDVLALKGKALVAIDLQKNATLNRAINRIYGKVIPAPHGEKALSAKNLRAAGINVAYHLYGRDDQTIGRFAELQLLYDSSGTAANYEDYYCVDTEGKRISAVGLRKDEALEQKLQSETKSNLVVDKQLLDVIRDALEWGEGTNPERLERIIAAARRTQQLERDLAAARARLEKLHAAQAIARSDIASVEAAKPDDIRSTPNAELMGSRKRGGAEEKLRRTIEAIQEYNAGRQLEEQIAINKGSLRKITKVKAQSVNEWVDEHAEAIVAYSHTQGHGYRQNVGKDLSVIKWNEDAYGVYEWPEGYFG
ncbi:MAG: hypothetical protein HC886_22485 [Leptolyngbyaceae cyanobacterium SM1_1_3]|nr:hypothetical protein [Leptolyngbyaceae cyanobacterium SM1_1_3]NJN05020.1 hypothetical protein [Leptolyngbyaceae cyanobacterium RM1_1_2]NJO11964.1 hypothetical protein [Leptolyngbyaceae cyanobacterium SL_1_1]